MHKNLICSAVVIALACALKLANFAIGADQPPPEYNMPVYLGTETETKSGNSFKLEITGNQYQAPQKTVYENQSLEENTMNVSFQGYAGPTGNLAPNTELQIVMDGKPIILNTPITPLANSGTKDFLIPGTNYTVNLAFFSRGAYYAVGINKITDKNVKETEVSTEFDIPVYVSTKPETKDGKKFEIRITDNQYAAPKSIRKSESFQGKPFSLAFQGYANTDGNLAPDAKLQLYINGILATLNETITPLQSSGIKTIEIQGTPYTLILAFDKKIDATFIPFIQKGESHFSVGIKDIDINPEIKNFQESIPRIKQQATDLLQKTKTELEDKITPIPAPNETITNRKNTLTQQVTALKNTLTAIVTENSNFPSLSEAGNQYIATSEKFLTDAQSTIDQLKQSLQTLTNDANTAVAEDKAKLESEQRTVIRDRANSLFTTMNEPALNTLKERLEHSEPNLKQTNKTDVDRLIKKTNELQESFKELNQTLSTSDFDIKETDQKLSSYETDFKKLNNEINQYTAKQKGIIIGKLAPIKDKVEKFTTRIKAIDNILSKITPPDATLNNQSSQITENLTLLRGEISGIENKLPTFSEDFGFYVLAESRIITDLNKMEADLPLLENNAKAKVAEIAAEKARVEAEEKAKATAESKRAKEIIDLAKNVNILLKTSIPRQLEYPLNEATINTKAEDKLTGLRSDIEKLKNPLTDILSNLENPDVNIISEQKVLAESQQAFDSLKTQVDAFITKNDKLNELEAKGQTEQPAPTDFPTPVYLTTNTDTVDGIKFELKMAGLRYQNSGTKTYEKAALGGDTVDTAFQGYANSNGILAPNTDLQILMDGKPVTLNTAITPLPNSANENKDFEIPGTDYTATIAYKYTPPGRLWGNAYYTVGIKKVINNKLTYEPVPNSFSIPVYVATNVETKDNNKFEIKLTGKQYVYPESIRKIESIEGKPFNLIFQGYANDSGNIDAGTQLQIYVNGDAITGSKPITPLQNSRTKDIEITTPDGQFYTITLAFYRSSTTFGYGENYYAVGIKNAEINKRLTDLKELQIEEDSIVRKAHFDSGIYIKPTQKAADGITATLGIEGYQSKFFADNINGFAFSGFANDKGYIYGPSSLVLTTNSGGKFLLGNSIVTTPISKTYPITVNGIPMLAGIEYKKQPADDFAKSRGLISSYLIELKDLKITPEEEKKRENEVKLNEEKTYLETNRPVYLNTKEKNIDQIDPTIQGTQGEAKFQLQFNGNIDRTIDPSISPQASYLGAGLVTYANTASGTLNSGSLKLLINGQEVTFDQGTGPIFKANTTQTVTIPGNPVSYITTIAYKAIKLADETTGDYAYIEFVNYQPEAKKKFDEERANLGNDLNELTESITSKLEYPLNKASINKQADNLKEYERLRGEITKLKDPLLSILNNLNTSDVSVDVVASNNILLGYAQKIDNLQKEVDAFITANNNLNNIDAKAKAEEAAKKDIVEQNAEFLKSNIPVYIIKDNMYKVGSLTFRVAFDNPITPMPALKKTAIIDGKNAEFVGYTDLSGKIDGATLGLYVDNIKHDLTATINKDTTQEIKFTAQDNTPYIARVDYSLQDNLDIIEPNSEEILPGGLLKRAYVIRLEPILEDEAAIKAAEEQRIAEEKTRLIDTVTALLTNINTYATKEITNVKDPFLSKNRAVLNTQINNLIRDIQGLRTSIENDTISPAEARTKLADYQKSAQSLIDNVILLKDNDKDITDKKQNIQSRAEAFRNEINNTLRMPSNFSAINPTISGLQTALEKEVNDLRFSMQNILNTVNSADFNIPGAIKILDGTDNSIKALKARIDNLVTENARLTTEKETADEIRNQNQALVEAGIQFLQTNAPVYIRESTTANSLVLDKFIPRKESILRNPAEIEGLSAKFVGYAPGGELADGASLILKMGTVPVKLTTTSKLPTTSGQQVVKITVPGDRPYETPYIVTYDVSYKALPILNTLLSAIPAAERDINTYVITLVSVAEDTQAIAVEEQKIKAAEDTKAAEERRILAEKTGLINSATALIDDMDAYVAREIVKLKNPSLSKDETELNTEITNLTREIKSLLTNIQNDAIDPAQAKSQLTAFRNSIESIKGKANSLKERDNELTNDKNNIKFIASGLLQKIKTELIIPSFSPFDNDISNKQKGLETKINNLISSIKTVINNTNTDKLSVSDAEKTLDNNDKEITTLKTEISSLVTENARLTTEKETADAIRNQNQALVDADIQFLQTNAPVYIRESTTANSLVLDKFIPRKESILRNPADIEGMSAKFVGYAPGGKLADGATLILKMGTVPVKLTTTSDLPTTSGAQVVKISLPGDRPYPTPYIVTYDVSHKALPVLNTLLSAIPASERDINTYVITLVSVAEDTQAIAVEEQKIKAAEDAKAAEERRILAEKTGLINSATALIDDMDAYVAREIVKIKNPLLSNDEAELNTNITNLTREIKSLRTKIENDAIDPVEARSQLAAFRNSIEAIKGTGNSLRERDNSLTNDKNNIKFIASGLLQKIKTELKIPSFSPFNNDISNKQKGLETSINNLIGSIKTVINNINIDKLSVSDAEKTLDNNDKEITTLKTEISSLVTENARLTTEKETADAIRNQNQALVDADIQFLQTNAPVYIRESTTANSLVLDKFIPRKESILRNPADIEGMSAKFVGYAPGGKLADGATLILKMGTVPVKLTATSELPATSGQQVVKISLPGDRSYPTPYIVTYDVFYKALPVLNTLLSTIPAAERDINTYVIALVSVAEDAQAIAIEEKKIKDAKAAEEAKAKAEADAKAAKLEADKADLRTKVNELINSIPTKLETPFIGVEINKKMETKLQSIKDEIAKLKLREGLTNIRNDLNAFDFTIDVNSIKRTLSDYEQKIDNFKKQIDEFLSTNTNLNDLDKAQEERDRIAEELRKMQEKEREAKEKEAQSQLTEVEFLKDHLPIYIDPSTIENIKLDFKDTVGIKSVLPKQISGDNFAGYADSNGNLYKGELLLRINNELYVVIPDGGKIHPDLSVTLGDTTYKVAVKEHRDDVGLKTSLPNTYAVKGYFIEIVPGSVQVEKKVAPTPAEPPRVKTPQEIFRERVRRHH